jgi:hypothetical protein
MDEAIVIPPYIVGVHTGDGFQSSFRPRPIAVKAGADRKASPEGTPGQDWPPHGATELPVSSTPPGSSALISTKMQLPAPQTP